MTSGGAMGAQPSGTDSFRVCIAFRRPIASWMPARDVLSRISTAARCSNAHKRASRSFMSRPPFSAERNLMTKKRGHGKADCAPV